jgi:hypothetical protein
MTGGPGSCCRPLHHPASLMTRDRHAADPPATWLPEGRRKPEPSPGAFAPLVPMPFGPCDRVIPQQAWLASRTRAPLGGWLYAVQLSQADNTRPFRTVHDLFSFVNP